MRVKYIKMINNEGGKEAIQADRVQRFLDQGYKIADSGQEVKSQTSKGSKNKITATAHVVTSSPEDESEAYAWNDEEEIKDLWPDQVEDEDEDSNQTAKKEK
jgi:hypothetical protein|tara:strand:- start:238 stop:543 length:306 start_codon:yes stop_codon:yes gene_type:complete